MHKDFLSESWRNELKKIPKFEELKKLLKDFSDTDFSLSSVKEIEEQYFGKINIYPGIGATLEPNDVNSMSFFRLRSNLDLNNENPALVSTFSYPPASICKWNGRANIPKHPVFYCSDSLNTSFLEIQPKSGDVIYASYWYVECNRRTNFCPILANNLSKSNPWHVFSDKVFKKILESVRDIGENKTEELKLLYKAFSYWFRDENSPYSKTSWFAHRCLYKNNGIDFLIYPSKATGQNSCSIAIHPNFVDNYMKLDKVVSFSVEEFNKELQGTSYRYNLRISINSIGRPSLTNIDWSAPKEEEALEFKRQLLNVYQNA